MTIDDTRFLLNFGNIPQITPIFGQDGFTASISSTPLFNPSLPTGFNDILGLDLTIQPSFDFGIENIMKNTFDMSRFVQNYELPDFTSILNPVKQDFGITNIFSDEPIATEKTKKTKKSKKVSKNKTKYTANTCKINGVDAVAMKGLNLNGKISSGNSVPYVAQNNIERLKVLDNYLASRGYSFSYTSAMGGTHASGPRSHGKGQKVDLVLNNGQQLKKEDVDWLKKNGFIGNGALGWHNAGSGYHYDLSIADNGALLA